MSKKVTIIVPVYNAEKTVERCVSSLLAQSYEDIEVIFVNDGSTDGTKEILARICSSDKRLRFISEKNAGAAAARNAGIDKASGDYICFVDADDVVSANYVSKMVEILESNKADIACAQYVNNKSGDFEVLSDSGKIMSSKESIDSLLRMKIANGPVAKLYRASVIGDIRMPHYKVAEDLYFNYEVFGKARKIAVNDSVLYNYIVRSGSLSTGRFSKERMQSLDAVERINVAEKSPASLARLFMEAYFVCESIVLAHAEHEFSGEYARVCEVISRNRKNILRDSHSTGRQKLIARLLAFGPKIAVNVMTAKSRFRR